MRKTVKWLVALVACLGLVVTLTGCSSSGNKATKTKTIKIATTGVSFPGSYKKNGKLTGFDVAVARAAAKELGYKVEFKTTSFDGLFGQLSSGKVDAIASNITITPERQKQYYLSNPYGYFKMGIAVSKKSTLTSVNQLSGKTIAATVGSNQIDQLKTFNKSIKTRTFDDREQALNAAANQQTDGYGNAKAILASDIHQKNLNLKILKGSFAESNIAFTFAHTSTGKKQQKQFNKAIKKLQKNGTLSKLSKKFFDGVDVSQK